MSIIQIIFFLNCASFWFVIYTIISLKKNMTLMPLWKKHFRQICFAVPNFNFIYINIKLKKLRAVPHIFWRNTQKLAIRENWASEESKCTLFVILQVKTLIGIVYRPQEKNMQIILNALWIFIIIHHFCMATFKSQHMGRWKT